MIAPGLTFELKVSIASLLLCDDCGPENLLLELFCYICKSSKLSFYL